MTNKKASSSFCHLSFDIRHSSRAPRRFLLLLLAINAMNFFDRQILAAINEPLRREWGLSDAQLGWLATAFTLLYAWAGVPLGRLADTRRRKSLLAASLAAWSGLTFASGLCRGFWSLFWARLGVGIGEAACAPVSNSLIGDLFPPGVRARAISILMAGLPLGVALSYVVGGAVAQHYGWRSAFFVAGVPGLLLALLLAPMPEPQRGMAEVHEVGAARRQGSPYLLVLGIPTMGWIIVSGALHNFNLYALSFFLPAFLIRHHQVTLQTAGFISSIVIGTAGAAGMLLSGLLGDRWIRRRANGRILLAGISLFVSAPAAYLALSQPQGSLTAFMIFQAIASLLMYVYYATVYATIHDIVEPALRGTAMALYFAAMYTLGASLGPLGTGWFSDRLARKAALDAGLPGSAVPERSKAIGLHQAMYLIPVVCVLIAVVLFAAARSVGRDKQNLQDWMRRETGGETQEPPPTLKGSKAF